MSFAPADFPGFGGLDLRDSEDVRGCIGILNVDPADMTKLRPRRGYTLLGTTDLSTSRAAMRKDTDVVVGTSTTLRLMDGSSGAVTASKTNYTASSYPWSLVVHGSTSDSTVYGADGVQLARYTTAAGFTAPTVSTQAAGVSGYTSGRAAPTPLALGVQPKDNRLVAGGYTGATGGPNGTTSAPDYLYFSQPEDPTKWDETDYVILTPGDGESIRAMVAFNNQLFVFKQSKFFVFYGNSVDSTGGAVFNYRAVENAFPGNTTTILPGHVCVAPDGVYVLTGQGVYKTTGGTPQLVTPQLSNAFADGSLTTLADTYCGTGGAYFHNGCVHFAVQYNQTYYYWLVINTATGDASIYLYADQVTLGAPHGLVVRAPSGVSTTGRKGLLVISSSYTDDNNTAISSSYTSPYLAYGEPKAEKHVRSSELHGTGTVTLAWGKDLQTHGTAETVAMSSGVGHARTGARGRVLSFKIAASAAGWTVNRVVPMLQSVRTGR